MGRTQEKLFQYREIIEERERGEREREREREREIGRERQWEERKRNYSNIEK